VVLQPDCPMKIEFGSFPVWELLKKLLGHDTEDFSFQGQHEADPFQVEPHHQTDGDFRASMPVPSPQGRETETPGPDQVTLSQVVRKIRYQACLIADFFRPKKCRNDLKDEIKGGQEIWEKAPN
jgi:hypothetical protein